MTDKDTITVMNTKEFMLTTGRLPENDDLERVNCDKAGSDGHIMCGTCKAHNMPVWEGHYRCPTQ
jgi:hypothetical protein